MSKAHLEGLALGQSSAEEVLDGVVKGRALGTVGRELGEGPLEVQNRPDAAGQAQGQPGAVLAAEADLEAATGRRQEALEDLRRASRHCEQVHQERHHRRGDRRGRRRRRGSSFHIGARRDRHLTTNRHRNGGGYRQQSIDTVTD